MSITIFVPDVVQAGHFEVNQIVNGAPSRIVYEPRAWRGWRVMEVQPQFFRSLLSGENGLAWERENPEVIEWIGRQEGNNEYGGSPFPGSGRPERVHAVAAEAAPVMVRLRAPTGVNSYSHGGVEGKIGADGTIEVLDDVAQDLRQHGFVAA